MKERCIVIWSNSSEVCFCGKIFNSNDDAWAHIYKEYDQDYKDYKALDKEEFWDEFAVIDETGGNERFKEYFEMKE